MDYRYNNKYKKKSSPFLLIFFFILIFSIASVVFIIYFLNKNKKKEQAVKTELKTNLKKYFEQKNYVLLIEKIDKELKDSPFSVEYLLYRGYSYFFLGEQENDIIKKKSFFSSSLIDLRKSLAIGITQKNKANLYFCLGKIYYYFGEPYYRLSIEYLLKSKQIESKKKDLHYMIGVVYSSMGDYKNSIESFKEALKIEETDMLLTAIGIIYYKNSDYENTINYMERVIKISNNPKIKERAFFILGEVFFIQNNFTDSKKYFDLVIELNENNASAYFYRGEIFLATGDKIKARAEWRKTLTIDPSHIRALRRIY